MSVPASEGDPDLTPLLSPRSLAVIGATERPGSVGLALMENLVRSGYEGEILPVNPRAGNILGRKAYARVEDAPGPVDAAIVMVPAPAVADVVEACGARGIKAAVVISAGFKECGEEGRKREAALREVAASHGMALIGPNCLGLINTGIGLNATFAKRTPKPGNISFLSQSGALGVYALEFAAANDIGLRLFASIGNKAALHENHLLRAFAADPVTKVLLAYLEDFQDPGKFLELAAGIASGPGPKPIVLLKAGTGKSGGRAAGSHTGALAEKMDFLDDVCAQYGILRAAGLEEMFDMAMCLANQPLPRGPRLAVLTNAGGPAILAADEAERQGLTLAEPSAALRASLSRDLPEAAGLRNPIDLLGDADAERYEKALGILLESSEVDSVIGICTPQMMTDMEDIASAVAAQASHDGSASKPLIAALARFSGPTEADFILDSVGIPNYAFPENAVRAMAAAWRHARWRGRERSAATGLRDDREAVRALLLRARGPVRALGLSEALAVLQAYGFPLARFQFAPSWRELKGAAAKLSFPLAAKIVSPELLHKSDFGGVVTGIRDAIELESACSRLFENAARSRPGGAAIDGILLQEMVPDGTEMMIGAHRHPHFGPLMAFGLGGTLVEALGDVRFRRAPLTDWDADEMISGIRSAAVLGEFRRRPPRDRAALRDCLQRLSRLMIDFPEIAEVDLNPVFALEKGACVADARIILSDRNGK